MNEQLTRLQAALAGRYAIERALGHGGMATVYLARDVRHDRKVALKVLRPELAAILGAERFLAEIKTTAHLQHPHILSLFDSGEADGLVYYVMPYVEGESLRDRLKREHQLPVDEAVRIACEVADALEYAHGHGIVHRDIKPENLLLHGGHALVVDFGIALAASRSEGATRLTETGMSLGTPHYMAPEQAMGEKEISPKADVYALGVVVYEMLTGEPPFTGPTAQAILARVMTDMPRPLTLQRHTIPPHIEAAVNRALEKLPADRFTSASAFAAALLGATSGSLPTARTVSISVRSIKRPVIAALVAIGLVTGGVVLGGVLQHAGSSAAAPIARLSVTLPAGQRLNAVAGPLGIAADGSAIAYSVGGTGTSHVYIRRLDDPVPREVTGAEGACCAEFSADGRWAYLYRNGALLKAPVEGGTPVDVPVPTGLRAGVMWATPAVVTTSDGHLAYLRPDGSLDTVAAPDVGTRRMLWAADVLPNDRILSILGGLGPLVSVQPRSGKRDTLVNALVADAYFDRGYIAWVEQSGVAFGARLDREGRRIVGHAVQLDAGVSVPLGGFPPFAASRSGMLVFVGAQPSELVIVDRTGRARPLPLQPRHFHCPRVSPDGRWIAVDVSEASSRDVWLLDRRDWSFSRFSFEHWGHDPMWTPDGHTVVFAAEVGGAAGIFMRNADGSGTAESVLVAGNELTAHTSGGPNHVLAVLLKGGGGDIVSVPLRGAHRVATPLLATPYNEAYPALSPDGRWLAYVSDESGRDEVYVRAFPGPGPRTIISQNGGTEPVWARSGRELFYRAASEVPKLMAASIDLRTEPRVLGRKALFAIDDYEGARPHANYDVLPDGSGFVMVRTGRASELNVILNWAELVRRQGGEQ